jgi:glycerol-3-phosphate O-acyltransferase
MATALVKLDHTEPALRNEFGPIGRALGRRYCPHVRVGPAAEAELQRLGAEGFVVHVQRTAAWVSFLYLAWLLISRGLPPIRAVFNMRRWFARPWTPGGPARTGRRAAGVRAAKERLGAGVPPDHRHRPRRWAERARGPLPCAGRPGAEERPPGVPRPELVVWEKWSARLKPAWADYLFGTPEAPGFLHSVLAFWRNHKRAQFRLGTPIDLRAFAAENPGDSDAMVARKVRGVLHVHLARETRAVFGPPYKPPERIIDETLRDRALARPSSRPPRGAARTRRHWSARPEAPQRDRGAAAPDGAGRSSRR